MHKTMSRIVVLLLVVCLALGNVVPALAADDTGDLSRGDGGSDCGSCGHPRGGDHGRNGDNSHGRADADGRNDRDSRNGGADRHADGRADRHAGTGSSHGGELSRRADGREGHERQDVRRQAGRR